MKKKLIHGLLRLLGARPLYVALWPPNYSSSFHRCSLTPEIVDLEVATYPASKVTKHIAYLVE